VTEDGPRLAMVVNNAVTGDSRVLRCAAAAVEAGFRVQVLGRSPSTERHRVELPDLPGAEVVLVPVPPGVARRERTPEARTLRRRARETLARRDAVAGHGGPGSRLRHGAWRLLDPWVQDFELALAPALEDLRPHVLHAHDRHTIALAARSVAALWARGHPTGWVLDAHEYVAATAARDAGRLRGAVRRRMVTGLQDEFIREADAVITVSESLARMLQADHRLRDEPTVVLNAPLVRRSRRPAQDVREAAGLDRGVPLLVYSGGCAPQRGVGTLVDVLPLLPTVHVALVAPPDDPGLADLVSRATAAGTSDRLHVLPYVPAQDVVGHLAGADVGVVPLLHRLNHEISLVTKYLEYLHAGLPVVCSDVREMATFTSTHGLGEVFPAGDVAGLARAVSTVLEAPDGYAAGRTPVLLDEYSWPRQAERLAAVYREVLVRGGRSPRM
jgi:glycogen synthase